jgi:hypothetical protein
MASEAARGEAGAREAGLQADGLHIGRLLEELRGMVGPPAWARVEELLRLVLDLQGAGLERLLDHALGAGAAIEDLERRLCGDELVSSLLLLHGLHPLPARARVERALADVCERLEVVVEESSLTQIDLDGIARIRLRVAGCTGPRPSLAQSVRRAVLDAAPELAGVEIDGGIGAAGERLVTIGPPRRGR